MILYANDTGKEPEDAPVVFDLGDLAAQALVERYATAYYQTQIAQCPECVRDNMAHWVVGKEGPRCYLCANGDCKRTTRIPHAMAVEAALLGDTLTVAEIKRLRKNHGLAHAVDLDFASFGESTIYRPVNDDGRKVAFP